MFAIAQKNVGEKRNEGRTSACPQNVPSSRNTMLERV